ncbi:MAG TPA: hypothetical protein VJM34_18620 [Novosphingobium sp.]|nr:hypothetical protein [Novosphingobium sp.]
MKASAAFTLAVAPLALAACSQERPADRPAVAPAATVVGSAESCIQLTQIRSSRIRDDYTIDFMGPGDRVWRNSLPNRCGGLRSADAFTYSTSLSQLCNTEIIYVLERVGGKPERGAGCGLGQFVPVRLEK